MQWIKYTREAETADELPLLMARCPLQVKKAPVPAACTRRRRRQKTSQQQKAPQPCDRWWNREAQPNKARSWTCFSLSNVRANCTFLVINNCRQQLNDPRPSRTRPPLHSGSQSRHHGTFKWLCSGSTHELIWQKFRPSVLGCNTHICPVCTYVYCHTSWSYHVKGFDGLMLCFPSTSQLTKTKHLLFHPGSVRHRKLKKDCKTSEILVMATRKIAWCVLQTQKAMNVTSGIVSYIIWTADVLVMMYR